MAKGNFEKLLPLILHHEGGYVNHPKDPGGATNKGITLNTYRAYKNNQGLTSNDLKRITNEEVSDIYRARYWNVIRGDDLPSGLDYAVFDFAVNSGNSRAIRYLQRLVDADDDGFMGPKTLEKVLKFNVSSLIVGLCYNRLQFMKSLKIWSTFGTGWKSRVDSVQEKSLKFI